MKYAIKYKQDGIDQPNFCFETEQDAAKAWFVRHHRNTSSIDMIIIDEEGTVYDVGCDSAVNIPYKNIPARFFFLNTVSQL